MKKLIVSLALLFTTFSLVFAQREMRPLTGNGTTKTLQYDIKAFENLEVLWLDGKIDVEFGAPKSDISIVTDENIFYLLKIENTESLPRTLGGALKLEIANNFKNRLWLEDDKTTIKIRTTAQPRQITYKANANATIKGINTTFLSIDKDENGNLTLMGKVQELNIHKKDNGALEAKNLEANITNINSSGNGMVSINSKSVQKQIVKGNGGLFNEMTDARSTSPKTKRINITFYNPTSKGSDYYVTGLNERGLKFSYGLRLESMEKQAEYLPVGTQVFRKGQLVATLSENDNNKIVELAAVKN